MAESKNYVVKYPSKSFQFINICLYLFINLEESYK